MSAIYYPLKMLILALAMIGVSHVHAQEILPLPENSFVSAQVEQGQKLFNRDWVAFPGRDPRGDGLGPVFNRVSCTGCHFEAGRGRPPETADEPFTSMVLRIGFTDELGTRAHIAYGEQINDRSIPNVPAEGKPRLSFIIVKGQYVDGEAYELRMPRYQIDDLNFGKIGWGIQFSGRLAQALPGIGLLEAIPEKDLEVFADPDDENEDGISGRLAELEDGFIGRFGWKATQTDLRKQTAQALHQDMGLRNSLHPEENCQWEQLACRTVAKSQELDVVTSQLDQLTMYQRALAPIPPKPTTSKGSQLFASAGCDACHQPNWYIDKDTWPAFLRETEIWPYTDLLLHDMGEGLSDGMFQGAASPQEWRTAPLWGLSKRQPLRLLHDGRARGVAEAILWHDGEGRESREAFRHMSKKDRLTLIEFVEEL